MLNQNLPQDQAASWPLPEQQGVTQCGWLWYFKHKSVMGMPSEDRFGITIEHHFPLPTGKGKLPRKLNFEMLSATSVSQKYLLASEILEAGEMPTQESACGLHDWHL